MRDTGRGRRDPAASCATPARRWRWTTSAPASRRCRYLTRLPFDTLKIDRYFVRTMGNDEGSAKIVRSVVNLGRDLYLEVVAEGVENAGLARAAAGRSAATTARASAMRPPCRPQEAEVYLNESLSDGVAPLKARSG